MKRNRMGEYEEWVEGKDKSNFEVHNDHYQYDRCQNFPKKNKPSKNPKKKLNSNFRTK